METGVTFEEQVKDGEIYRRRVCDRCGVVGYDRLLGFETEEWKRPEPKYQTGGFSVGMLWGRGSVTLCTRCAEQLRAASAQFMRNKGGGVTVD